jgi:hypothetical protein
MLNLITKSKIKDIAEMMIILYGETISKYQIKQSIDKLLAKHSFLISPNEKEIITKKIWQQVKKKIK